MLSFLSLILLRFSLPLLFSILISAYFAMLFFIIILLMVCQDLGIYLFIVFIKFGNFFSHSVKFLLSSSLVPPPSLELVTGGSLDITPWVSCSLHVFPPVPVLYFLREPVAVSSSPLIFSFVVLGCKSHSV